MGPRSRWGDTPSQVWTGGGGYPILLTGGRYPIQDQDGGTLGTPLLSAEWGTPCPRLDGVTPIPPPPNQQSEHLLRGGRCASCGHAGGLSCLLMISTARLETTDSGQMVHCYSNVHLPTVMRKEVSRLNVLQYSELFQ